MASRQVHAAQGACAVFTRRRNDAHEGAPLSLNRDSFVDSTRWKRNFYKNSYFVIFRSAQKLVLPFLLVLKTLLRKGLPIQKQALTHLKAPNNTHRLIVLLHKRTFTHCCSPQCYGSSPRIPAAEPLGATEGSVTYF